MTADGLELTDSQSVISFTRRDQLPGLEIFDRVERRQCSIRTPESVVPRAVPTEEFYFPVDQGIQITVDQLTIPQTMAVCVRNHAGWLIDELTRGESRSLPVDLYSIEFPGPIKLYTVIESSCSIEVDTDSVSMSFAEPTEVFIGARSLHTKPAGTITTTPREKDMMRAMSYFGSALKTLSVERSYPTLRGHPPRIELGETFAVPDTIEPVDSDVVIEIPSRLDYIYQIASLAFYLGATVSPGSPPRIRTETGFEYQLDQPDSDFETTVKRVLQRIFFLDCLTRTEGYYPVNLHERNKIESIIDLDFARLYDQSIPTQLSEYLSIPYSRIQQYLPQWKLTAHLTPTLENVEVLPFVVNDLAMISCEGETGTADTSSIPGDQSSGASKVNQSSGVSNTVSRTDVEDTAALDNVWIGKGNPVWASKGLKSAYEHGLSREPTEGDIEITLVCNSSDIADETTSLQDIYGSREQLPFSISCYENIRREELRSLLKEQTDYFHYIGHIDQDGYACADGKFDAGSITEVGIDVFFLNACSSMEQGIHLIEGGSQAGIVTVSDVVNSFAERIGKRVARLLNSGFPLKLALTLAQDHSLMGNQYAVIGNGSVDVTQPESGNPVYCHINNSGGKYQVNYQSIPNSTKGLGTITVPYISDNADYYLVGSQQATFTLSEEELEDFLSIDTIPIIYEETLWWSDDLLQSSDVL